MNYLSQQVLEAELEIRPIVLGSIVIKSYSTSFHVVILGQSRFTKADLLKTLRSTTRYYTS